MVEIGYGLIPAARGQGYAGEALLALMAIADEHGIVGFRPDTNRDNFASQRTLTHAGFEQVAADDELLHYEAPGATTGMNACRFASPELDPLAKTISVAAADSR